MTGTFVCPLSWYGDGAQDTSTPAASGARETRAMTKAKSSLEDVAFKEIMKNYKQGIFQIDKPTISSVTLHGQLFSPKKTTRKALSNKTKEDILNENLQKSKNKMTENSVTGDVQILKANIEDILVLEFGQA